MLAYRRIVQLYKTIVLYHTSSRFLQEEKMNTSSRPLEHPGGIIGCKDKRAPMVLIVTLGHQCSIMFFCGTVYLLMTTTKLRSDAFVQATGDFDGNLCIFLSYCRVSCCGSGWCTKA